jgi:hypothetical protein
VRKSDRVKTLSAAGGMLAAFAALTVAAPIAHADPALPAPPDPALPAPPLPGPPLQPGPEESISTQAAADDPALPAPPPAEVPHLLSPDNLPPGTSAVPVEPPQSRGTSYLRDLFHAFQTQEISGKDALLLLTQRPLDANAMPTNGMPPGPQAPPGTPPPLDAPAPDAPAPDALPPPPGLDPPPPGPTLTEAPPPAP